VCRNCVYVVPIQRILDNGDSATTQKPAICGDSGGIIGGTSQSEVWILQGFFKSHSTFLFHGDLQGFSISGGFWLIGSQ
jgi:hypothetical protein